MEGIVDRFEGDYVVIEIDGATQDIPQEKVNEDVRVGDVVVLQAGVWVKNVSSTVKRSEEIKKLMDDVWAD